VEQRNNGQPLGSAHLGHQEATDLPQSPNQATRTVCLPSPPPCWKLVHFFVPTANRQPTSPVLQTLRRVLLHHGCATTTTTTTTTRQVTTNNPPPSDREPPRRIQDRHSSSILHSNFLQRPSNNYEKPRRQSIATCKRQRRGDHAPLHLQPPREGSALSQLLKPPSAEHCF